MSLTITSERVHALIRDLAKQTGQSQSEAVEEAVRRRLAELQGEAGARQEATKFSAEETAQRRATIEHILSELYAETSPEQWAALDAAQDSLYDRAGLPA